MPALPTIVERTVTIESPLSFTIVGTDSDVPLQTLTYSLDPGAPTWASINPTSGLFAASVTGAVPDGTYPVTVRVTDNGAGTLSATRTFNLVVDNNRPNLIAQSIASVGSLTPGSPFTLNWQIDNIGSESANGSWTERIYLSNSPTGANRQLLTSFSYSGPIVPSDDPIPRSESITLPLTSLNGPVYFVVEVDATNNVVESDESNFFVSATSVVVPAVLTMTFSGNSVAEGGSAIQGTLTRNGDVTAPLVVTLTPSVAGQLTAPATVTIPAGQYTQRFTVSATDNTVVETTQVVSIEATAAAFAAASRPLTVLDNDQPGLTLTFPVIEAAEGQVVRGRITRDLPAGQDLLINIVSSDNAQLGVPLAVVLPAGQSAVEFDATAVDDTLLERLASYSISVNAPGHVGSSVGLDIPQSDVPNLSLTVPSMLSEGSVGPTVIGTITRSIVSTQAVVVELSSSNSTLVGVPATVTIPAGAVSATFPITVADDDLVNGSRSANITARVRRRPAERRLWKGRRPQCRKSSTTTVPRFP